MDTFGTIEIYNTELHKSLPRPAVTGLALASTSQFLPWMLGRSVFVLPLYPCTSFLLDLAFMNSLTWYFC